MAYITKYNFGIVFKEINCSKALESLSVDGRIYPDIEFSFFNKLEREELLHFKQFVQQPDFYIEHYLVNYQPEKDSRFLNDVDKKPAYHKDMNCKRLLSDFEGWVIPRCIWEQGLEVRNKFRQFYRENKRLFDENPRAFEMRASIAFQTKIKIESIVKPNSGVHEINNVILQNVKDDIIMLWNDLKNWLKEGPENEKKTTLFRYFGDKTFLVTSNSYKNSPIKYNRTKYADKEIREFLDVLYQKYKHPMMDRLKLYYMAEYNPNLEMNGKLLDKLGFVPCASCYSQTMESLDGSLLNLISCEQIIREDIINLQQSK